MIDFTGCKVLVNSYEGADFKRKIIYDGDVYMLKFGQKLESDERKPMQASYASTPVSEYLGSHIYALAGLPTQHTVMGTYDGRPVVACRDFIESRPDAENVTLVEFKKLENSFLGSSTAGGRTPILDNLLGKLTAERVEVPADLALDDVEVAAHGVSFPLCRYHHSKLPTHKYGKVGTYIYRTQPFSWTRGNDSPMPRKRGHPVGCPLHRPARRFRMTCKGTGHMPRREKPHGPIGRSRSARTHPP